MKRNRNMHCREGRKLTNVEGKCVGGWEVEWAAVNYIYI